MAISHANVGDNVLAKTNEIIDAINNSGAGGSDAVVDYGTVPGNYDYVLWESTRYEQRGTVTLASGSGAAEEVVKYGRTIYGNPSIILSANPLLAGVTLRIVSRNTTGFSIRATGTRSEAMTVYYQIVSATSEPAPK